MLFAELPVQCDLCLVTLQEAARELGPSFVYELHVHPSQYLWARSMILDYCMHTAAHNPLSPMINLHEYSFKKVRTWVLEANDRKVGSTGI